TFFGAGMAADAFIVAFRIPNLLRDFFAENALSASFIPVFVEKMQGGNRRDMWRFSNNLFNTLLIVVGVIVAAGVVFSPQVVSVIAGGYRSDPEKFNLTVRLTRILFPFLLFISLAAWSQGVLNAHDRFFLPAVSPAFFNLLSIAGALIAWRFAASLGLKYEIVGLAVGGMVGVFLQFLIPYIFVWGKGYRYRPYINWRSRALGKVLRLWIPVVIGLGLFEIQAAVDTLLATLLEEGSVSWLYYAYRIMHLPLAIFGAAVGTVSLPLFSRLREQGKFNEFASSLKRSLRTVSVLLIPVALFMIAFSLPITRVIFQHMAFTPRDTSYTSQALVFYVAGIWAASSVRTLVPAFYAFRKPVVPMLVNLGSVILNISMNLILAFVVFQVRQFRAFAIATTTCSFLSMIVLMIILKRRLPGWKALDHPLFGLRSAAAGFLAILPVYLSYRLYFINVVEGFWFALLMLAAAFAVFVLLYYIFARLFGIKEILTILKRHSRT
ncbi:murein biosynthesis integral membrane protein MurJ, partial [candidate division WOR-3 bacterium]|nr:murein biosynthesis integral membrane protein MurJ [candidate division WOR-3 bacterium]MBD3365113.1 murein biosynthesis integral membrane protein MurJ [candidate division WOR-3 bacterium]